MSSIAAPSVTAALTADGDNTGFVTVASNALFYPGATAFLISTMAPSQECIITELSGATRIGLRFLNRTDASGRVPGPYFGRNDCSAYKAADSANITQPAQAVRVEPAFSKLEKI